RVRSPTACGPVEVAGRIDGELSTGPPQHRIDGRESADMSVRVGLIDIVAGETVELPVLADNRRRPRVLGAGSVLEIMEVKRTGGGGHRRSADEQYVEHAQNRVETTTAQKTAGGFKSEFHRTLFAP